MQDSAIERVTNAVLSFLAVWTLLCNVVVFSGGNLHQLLALAALSAAAGFLLGWRRRRHRRESGSEPRAAGPPASAAGQAAPSLEARLAVLAAALACLAILAATENLGLFWAGATLLCLALLLRELARGPGWARPALAPPRGGQLGLWILVLFCVAVSLTLQRPDADDAFYLNLAVSAADRPEAPLIAGDTLHGIPGVPLSLPVYKVHGLELLQAALAYLTPLRVLDVAHLLVPALAGLLLPLAHARLIRLLAPQRWLWGVIVGVAVLLCIGDTHRGYGNFSFVRLQQGKAILLSVMLPLVAATALEFALEPGWKRFLRLAAAQIAALGVSATALWAAPVTAGLALASATDPRRLAIRNLLWGLLASAYVLAVALVLRGETAGLFRSAGDRWQERASAVNAMELVLGGGAGGYLFLFALIGSWGLATSDLLRRFCIVFALGFLLLFWNPFTDSWVAAWVTGEPTYWRVFWLAPLPLLLALALTAPLDLLPDRRLRWAAFLLPAAAVLLWAPASATWARENDVRFGWPQWRLPEGTGEAARAVARYTEPGDLVLASAAVGPWIPALHHHPTPLVVRYLYLEALRGWIPGEEYERRQALVGLVSGWGRLPDGEALLEEAIAGYPLAAVCLTGRARRWPELQRALRRSPLLRVAQGRSYEVWARP